MVLQSAGGATCLTLLKLLPVVSFLAPIIILYALFPNSFETTWKGRSYYFIFIWLATMVVILNWKAMNKIKSLRSLRTATLAVVSIIPSAYVAYADISGLNSIIADFAQGSNIYLYQWVPLSVEYFIFAALFGLVVTLLYGVKGLEDFSLPMALLVVIGVIYTIDDVYPFGRFTPLQILVPTTATLASSVLNFFGYQTSFVGSFEGTTVLQASNMTGSATLGIAWPCAGIDGLIIYTVTILLFLKSSPITMRHRLAYFAFGAVVTYLINIFRIAAIFIIAVGQGDYVGFHDYYAQLITVIWIVSYMLIITVTQLTRQKSMTLHGGTPPGPYPDKADYLKQ